MIEEAPVQQAQPWTYQVQIVSPDVNIYNFAMAHLRTTPGVTQVVPVSINPGGVSYVNVTYSGGDLSRACACAGVAWLERRAERIRPAHVVRFGAALRRYRRRATSATAGTTPTAAAPLAAADAADSAAEEQRMKRGADQIALPLDWPQTEGESPVHRLQCQPRGVRALPQVEHVAGQGDHPDRTAALGSHSACKDVRRAGSMGG